MPEREADHSPPSNAEVKNVWSYNSTDLFLVSVKVKLPLCLTKHHAMKMYGEIEV
jgi:hypothetical protein